MLERFWFRPVSAAGFGLMRVAFGLVSIAALLPQWDSVLRYYSDSGFLPHAAIELFVRSEFRFSILDHVADPTHVFWLYLSLLLSLALVTLGVWTRVALLASTILLFSFHEYGTVALHGGDTVLRLLALLLLLSPSHRCFTVTNAWRRIRRVVKEGSDQPADERTMPIWPYRLLLWQMILMYLSSTEEKLTGAAWLDGSAVAITLHHPHFSRLSPELADMLTFASPIATYFVLAIQASWVLLLLYPIIEWVSPAPLRLTSEAIKRALLIGGAMMHIGIALAMDVGVFSYAMLAAYLGLLTDDDFRAIRQFCNRERQPIVVLFDGSCGLCRRSVTVLKMLDWLRRLRFVDFTDTRARQRHAPDIALARLEKSIHIKLPSGEFLRGFRAFRHLCRHLPPLWVMLPIFYLPGALTIGDWVYDNVASKRMRCGDGACKI